MEERGRLTVKLAPGRALVIGDVRIEVHPVSVGLGARVTIEAPKSMPIFREDRPAATTADAADE